MQHSNDNLSCRTAVFHIIASNEKGGMTRPPMVFHASFFLKGLCAASLCQCYLLYFKSVLPVQREKQECKPGLWVKENLRRCHFVEITFIRACCRLSRERLCPEFPTQPN